MKAGQARIAIDLSWYLREWRNRLGEVRERQRELRDQEKIWRRGRVRREWERWRRRKEEEVERRRERRRREREDSLRRAFAVVNARWEDKARKECFVVSLLFCGVGREEAGAELTINITQHWRQRALDSRATNFRRANLLGAALQKWRTKGDRLADLRILADRFTKQQVLVAWLRKGELQYLEGNFVHLKEEKLLTRFWDWWRDQTLVFVPEGTPTKI